MSSIEKIIFNGITLPLEGKNLIITGKNGAGKTYILDNIYSEIKSTISDTNYIRKNLRFKRERILDELSIAFNNFSNILELKNDDREIFSDLMKNIDIYNTYTFSSKLNKLKKSIIEKYNIFQQNHKKYLESQITDVYTEFNPKSEFKNSLRKEYYYKNSSHLNFYIQDLKNQLNKFSDSPISIQMSNKFNQNNNLVINFFNAKRTETIEKISKSDDVSIYSNLDNLFEEYLISQFNSNFPIKKFISDDEFEYIDQNNNWLNKVESDLQYIFEEKNTKILFDKFQKKIVIISGKKHFSLNRLSSGLQAIFKIYSSLLMRTKLTNIDPIELFGIVIIDEIDVHLHISLQKKIMPFLTNAFPKIQFIVSTHSPFVITSQNTNTAIFDLTTHEFIEEDLSHYSHESIIKELFHVESDSEETSNVSKLIIEFVENDMHRDNLQEIKATLEKMEIELSNLSIESQLQFIVAKNKLEKLKNEGLN